MISAFIGSGNMVRAIIGGLVRSGAAPQDIFVINPGNPKSAAEAAEAYGVISAPPEALKDADTVIFGIKPQSFADAAAFYGPLIGKNSLVISIMAGISVKTIEEALGARRVIRVMPNLALSAGYGASGYALGGGATEADAKTAGDIFSASGIALRVSEEQIDDVTALSGSGAAYICLLVEALRDSAVQEGLDPETAALLAKQTLFGAARLIEAGGLDPEELRRRITSAKGTTDAAVRAMTQAGFEDAVRAGYRANKARSAELAQPARD